MAGRKSLVLWILLFFRFTCLAQQELTHYSFTLYNTSDGLAPGTVNSLWNDGEGYLWLLSENGLSRYDGYDFIHFKHKPGDSSTISSPHIVAGFKDAENNHVFVSANSLMHYDRTKRSFSVFHSFVDHRDYINHWNYNNETFVLFKRELIRYSKRKKGIAVIKIKNVNAELRNAQSFFIPSGILICSKNTHLFFDFKSSSFKPVDRRLRDGSSTELPLESGPDLLYSSAGNIYLSTPGHLYFYNSKSYCFTEIPARNTELNAARFSLEPVAARTGDYYYLLKQTGMLYRFFLPGGKVDSVSIWPQLEGMHPSRSNFKSLFVGKEGHLWITTHYSGFARIDCNNFEKGIVDQVWTGNSDIPFNNCAVLMDTDEQVIWTYAPAKGLVKIEKTYPVFQSYLNTSDTLELASQEYNIRSVVFTNDSIGVVATLNGVKVINIRTNTYESLRANPFTFDKGSYSDVNMDGQGNLYIAGWGNSKIFKVHPDFSAAVQIKLTASGKERGVALRSSCFFKNSMYWGSSQNSVYVYDTNSFFSSESVREIGLKRSKNAQNTGVIFQLFPLNNDELLLGASTGIFVLSLSQDSISRFSEDIRNEFAYADVRSLYIDRKQQLWIGTNGNGLYRYHLSDQTIKNYTAENGGLDNSVYSILADKKEELWMGTNTGIHFFDPISDKFKSFSTKDGMSFSEYNTNAATLLPDKRMAFGGLSGLTVFEPEKVLIKTKPLRLVVSRILVNNMERTISDLIRLKHDEHYITFEFAALGFYRNDEIQYAYRMEGLDNDWINCGTRRFTNYANVPPGKYTMLIRAASPHGEWTGQILKIPIVIALPFYKTPLAIFIFILLLAGLSLIFILYRTRQRQQLQNIRDNIARDLHDEIGSNLSSISIFNEVAKDKLKRRSNELDTLHVLDKIGQYAQISQEAMNDIVWMIDSRNDRFENILIKMRTFAAETVGASDTVLHLRLDESLTDIRIDMGKRKNFYLIYKEAINNLMKYAQAKNVVVELSVENSFVCLKIEDDGIGFDPEFTSGNGMRNMQRRAEELQGMLTVSSKEGQGTAIHLKFLP